MKYLIATLMAAACVRADVSHITNQSPDQAATVLRNEGEVKENGFNYVFETSNGIAAQAQGQLKDVAGNPGLVHEGSFQFKTGDGQNILTSYIADENGYQPQGAHLPTPPPIPRDILRALEYIAAHPPPKEPEARTVG